VKLLTLNNILRYGFGGFLLTAMALLYHADVMKKVFESAGPVIAPLVVLAIGVAWYCFHRYVLGELLIYPFTSFLHNLCDRLRCRSSTNPVKYLKSLGVRFGERRSAYTDIRRSIDQLAKRQLLERLDLLHAEYHVLAMTAELMLMGAFYGLHRTYPLGAVFPLFAIAMTSALAAVYMDIQLHRGEHRLLSRQLPIADLRSFLSERGYIEPK